MADITGKELIKQDVAEGNHDSMNESHDEYNQEVPIKTMSETSSSKISEDRVDDDSSTLFYFNDYRDGGVRSSGLHSALLSQTSISTTDSVVDTCDQQEANASNLQEDASGDHSKNSDIAEVELFAPQSDVNNADSRVSQEKTQEADVHSIEERSKEGRQDIIEKTSFYPGSENEEKCNASLVNCIEDSDVHSLKKKENESVDTIKSSIPGHLLFENNENPNHVAVETNGETNILSQNKEEVDEYKFDELKIDKVPRKASSKVNPLDTGVRFTGGIQCFDWFHGQPNKDEDKDLAFELCKKHGRPQSLFCIVCELSLCDSFACRSIHFEHAVEEKDDISNSVMEKLKTTLDYIDSGENIVKFLERTEIKQQFLVR
ncbi:uncharacterized protein LOC117115747 [Anneissia japonica]|uniref:uncharacterized protein LOC117115747 n=1 Tax=Anneissia japonica TaxID=1529436 RepID=UPI0014256DDD|nr:uncharacterized protein LOC117115747 [Anneissia japonica]